jgi:DNA-binding transcriptional LysR family regulator
VRALEEEVGERLFLRLGRETLLTQAGKLFLEHVEESFDALDRGMARIGGLGELREGHLTVCTSDTTACYVLPNVLQEFSRRYPGVEVRISNRPSPVAVGQVAARQADIGVVTLPVTHPSLTVEPLVLREDVAICPPKHPLAGRKRIALPRLLEHPLLLLDRGSNTRAFIDKQIAESGISPHIAMELGSIEVINRLVQLGFGVSIVPRVAVDGPVSRGILHTLRVFDKRDCRVLGIIHPASGIANPAGRVFVDMLRKRIGAKGRI